MDYRKPFETATPEAVGIRSEGDDRPGHNGTSVQSQVEREKTVATNEGSPVRTTGRWDSYEVKCMTGRDVPYGDKKPIVRGYR